MILQKEIFGLLDLLLEIQKNDDDFVIFYSFAI